MKRFCSLRSIGVYENGIFSSLRSRVCYENKKIFFFVSEHATKTGLFPLFVAGAGHGIKAAK